MALKSSNHPKKYSFKSEKDLYRQLQIYLNNLIDKKVNQINDPDLNKYTANSFAQEAIFLNIFSLNNPTIVRDFQTILNSPLTDNNAVTRNLISVSADNTARIISELETERVLKNLEYVERTLEQSKIDLDKYNSLSEKLSPTVSRQEILERSLEEGKMYNGRDLSYKELNNLAKNLENYKTHRVDYDEALAINEEARANGLPPVYTHKKWIWSGLENTRHSNMDDEIVELEDMFEVKNEVSGDIDHLLFPGDVENYHNPGNIINCGCTYEIISDYSDYEEINNQLSEDSLKELDKKYSKEYSENVKRSMKMYSDDGNIVNDCLINHNGKWNSDLETKYGINEQKYKNMVKNLNNSQVKLVEDTNLFRGFKNNVNDFYLGQSIEHSGFASTSFDRGVAKFHATEKGSILQIDAPKGTKGVYIKQNSLRPEEVEFLLPKGTVLEVYKINKSNGIVHCALNYL